MSSSPSALGGRGSQMVKESDRGWPCHKFEPSTTKDPPCREAMHVKSVQSSKILPLDFPEVINSIIVVKILKPTDISFVWVPF
ncbi:hypothetical protein TNCV_4963581 [Trichonephila clavipes]|nr:hypothetical protein TNCV_4963581 [Trichonephila clavipes]